MTADETTVRFAAAHEVDAAIAVWRAANEARTAGPPDSREVEATVRRWMTGSDAALLVAERASRIVGTALAVNGREDSGAGPGIPGLLHISLVFVVPDAWGEGISARLVDALLLEAGLRGYSRAQLWTHETNTRARRLYTSSRFLLTGDREVNSAGETIMRFERPL